MKKVQCILLIMLLCACEAADNSYSLQWSVSAGEDVVFYATNTEVPLDERFAIDGFDILNDDALKARVIQDFSSLEIPTPTYQATLVAHKEGLRLKVVGIVPEYNTEPESEDEKLAREMIEARAGDVSLLADIDSKGDLASFYLRHKQKNFLAFLFRLPDDKVKPGDSWHIPMNLIDIGAGFVPDESVRDGRATFEALTYNTQGDAIANLFYVFTEKVTGQFEYSYTDEVVPMSIQYTYLASSKFNIDQGRWESFVGAGYVSGEGLSINEHLTIFALQPE
jgi:hypothetical protein